MHINAPVFSCLHTANHYSDFHEERYTYPPFLADLNKACMSMIYSDDDDVHGKWEPMSCETKLAYLCEDGKRQFHF